MIINFYETLFKSFLIFKNDDDFYYSDKYIQVKNAIDVNPEKKFHRNDHIYQKVFVSQETNITIEYVNKWKEKDLTFMIAYQQGIFCEYNRYKGYINSSVPVMANETANFSQYFADPEVDDSRNCGQDSTLGENEIVEISSPGFDSNENYPANANCLWQVKAPMGFVINAQIQEMEVRKQKINHYEIWNIIIPLSD